MSAAAPTGRPERIDVSPHTCPAHRRPLSSRRKWLFRLMALSFPIVCLPVLELALNGMGVGKNLGLLIPVETSTPRGMIRFNPDVDLPYYGATDLAGPEPRPFALAKAAGTFRIVVIGASTVQGFPYPPDLAFPRLLEITLQHQRKNRKFEVLNAGIIAITSTCEADVLEQTVACAPDLIVVYTGHNEFIGPGGVSSNFPVPHPAWARAFYAARRTRLLQVASRILGLQKRDNRPLFDQLPGDLRIPLNSAKFRRAEDQLRANLGRMIEIAERARIPLLLTTPAVNLRNQSPIVSFSRNGLPVRESDEWQNALDLGEELLRQNEHQAALDSFDQARAIDDGHALLAFRRAQCLEGLQRWEDALESYRAACDLDGCRIRMPSSFAKIIREAAGRAGPDSMVRFLDTASIFARGSPHGIPGAESFLEHVHFTYSGHWRLANILAEHITSTILRESWQEPLVPSVANRDDMCGVILQDHCVAKGIAAKMLQQSPLDLATDVALQSEGMHSDFWKSIEGLSPDEAEVLLNLMNACLVQLQSDVIRPLALSYEGAEMYREEENVLRRGVGRQPWRADLLLDLAECEFRDGNESQARALSERAAKWKPNRVRLRDLQQKLDHGNRKSSPRG